MIKSVSLPVKTDYVSIDDNSAKIIIDGCYPGYGTTLGNAIRRVLLSSLPGAAATSVKITDVLHEFSTIPGVTEDVIQIILNVKKVRFKLLESIEEPIKVSIKEKGEKVVTAGDIKCPAGVEVVNKDAVIAVVTDKKADFEMEIEISRGLGYVPVEQQDRETNEIGVIAIDAIFTPIRRVNFTVENTRVGKRTDYDKITLYIETDGTITPLDAYEKSVEILLAQFESLKAMQKTEGIQQGEEDLIKVGDASASFLSQDKKKIDDNNLPSAGEQENYLNIRVDSMGFSTRTANCLEKASITTIGDIIEKTESELLSIEGMGEKSIKEIKKAIGSYGFTLKAE